MLLKNAIMESNDKNKDTTKNRDAATGVETPPPPQIMDPSSQKEIEDKKAPEGKNESVTKSDKKKTKVKK
jgi:hypothetical protein